MKSNDPEINLFLLQTNTYGGGGCTLLGGKEGNSWTSDKRGSVITWRDSF